MLDPTLFTVERLLATMLDDFGNTDPWRKHAEILPAYRASYEKDGTRTKCVVRIGDYFLCYSKGPGPGVFWNNYGDDFLTPELALLALLQAPVPAFLLDLSSVMK